MTTKPTTRRPWQGNRLVYLSPGELAELLRLLQSARPENGTSDTRRRLVRKLREALR